METSSGSRWPLPTAEGPGAWVAPAGGARAAQPPGLPHWIDEELWLVELAEPVLPEETRLVGSRGRLLRRVERWTPALARELAEACAWRARDQAVGALRGRGCATLADDLAGARELADVERLVAATAAADLPAHVAFAADAAALARGARPEAWLADTACTGHPRQAPAATAANLCFVVAHTAGLAAVEERGAAAYEAGVQAERAWQAAWLADRLGLAG